MSKKSKKKQEAKLALLKAKRDVIARRVDAALAEFMSSFPSPYASDEEDGLDRETCERYRREAATDAETEFAPVFEQDDGGRFGFTSWVFAYRDELNKRYNSSAIVEDRIRFQLARLLHDDARLRKSLHPDVLRVARAFLRRTALFAGYADPKFVDEILDAAKGSAEPMANPYDGSQGEFEADMELVARAWELNFGQDSFRDGFCPPFYVADDKGLAPAPWTGDLGDLMIEKYGSLDAARPRWRFLLYYLSQFALEEHEEAIIDFRSDHQRAAFEQMLDRMREARAES